MTPRSNGRRSKRSRSSSTATARRRPRGAAGARLVGPKPSRRRRRRALVGRAEGARWRSRLSGAAPIPTTEPHGFGRRCAEPTVLRASCLRSPSSACCHAVLVARSIGRPARAARALRERRGMLVLDLSASVYEDAFGQTIREAGALGRRHRRDRVLGRGVRAAAAGHAGPRAVAAAPVVPAGGGEHERRCCRTTRG